MIVHTLTIFIRFDFDPGLVDATTVTIALGGAAGVATYSYFGRSIGAA
jgi:hypothetical protein